jgi:hypothetical protein
MVLEINEAFTTVLMVTDENGNPASGKTISYRLFDEAMGVFASGSMTELGVYGIYYTTWTPDAAGYWIFEAYYSGTDFKFYDIKMYPVEKGEEKDIETILKHGTYGNAALNTDLDLILTRLGTPNYTTIVGDIANLITRSKGLEDIYNYISGPFYTALTTDRLDHTTYGLSALNTDLDAIISSLGNGTYGLSALETLVDEVESLLKDAGYGLSALNVDLDSIIANIGNFQGRTNQKTILAALGIPDAVSSDLYTLLITNRLDSGTFGLSALNTNIGRKVVHQDFWSAPVAAVAITAAESNINLPNVVVAGLPAGATITRVEVLFKCRLIRDSSTADNAVHDLDADFFISVDADPARASKVNAIAILEDFWSVDVSTSPDTGGDVIVGSTDVKAEVTVDGTYYLTMDNAQADGANLNLLDVMVGLRIYWY